MYVLFVNSIVQLVELITSEDSVVELVKLVSLVDSVMEPVRVGTYDVPVDAFK